jgi:3-dehydroquinate dehydratase-2
VTALLLLNGPNLNLLGERNPAVYGRTTLLDIEAMVAAAANERAAAVIAHQANSEGALIDVLQDLRRTVDGVILNAGGYTHTSVALRDAIEGVQLPTVEVHISNVHARDGFRRRSMIAAVCIGQVAGLGPVGYVVATRLLLDWLQRAEGDRE